MLRRTFVPSLLILLQFASLAAAQVTLERKYPEGAVNKFKESVKVHQILTLAGMDLETRSDTVTVTKQTNGTPNSDGQPVTSTTESVNANIQLPAGAGNIQFDSANPNVKAANPMFEVVLDIMRAMSGAKLTYTIGKDKKIASVDGYQDVIRQATQAAADQLKKELTAERLTAEYQQGLDALPATPLKPGDTWNRTEVMNAGSGQTITFDRQYKYEGTVDQKGTKLEKITAQDQKVRFALDPNGGLPLSVKSSDLKIESSKIEVLFDRERGVVVSTTNDGHIKGDMTFVINGMELPGKLDLELSRSVESVQ